MGQLKEVLAVCWYSVTLWLLGCHLTAEGLREGEGKEGGEMEEEDWRGETGREGEGRQ